jgi:recombination protein RecR
MKYPDQLLKLIEVLKQLPGVGHKSAERFAFHMIQWSPQKLSEMAKIIQQTPEKLSHCKECGSLISDQCLFCNPKRLQAGSLCIVASPRDVFAIESTHEYRGLYHVLGNLLSPMEGIGPQQLNIDLLKKRLTKHEINEVIVAIDSTLEGDATALFLKKELEALNITVSRLAFGLPLGSSLDYVDGGTLARALMARAKY